MGLELDLKLCDAGGAGSEDAARSGIAAASRVLGQPGAHVTA